MNDQNPFSGRQLDRLLTIERPAQTPDAYGQTGRKRGTWEVFKAGIWAAKMDGGGDKEAYPEGRETATAKTRFLVRYGTGKGITAQMRLYDHRDVPEGATEPTQYYEIIAPPRELGRGQGWELLTEIRY
jgi:head-tail adaptor